LVMLGPASLNEEVLILDLEREVDLELPHNLARLLSGALRRSDAAGRVGHTEFAVVAPGTDESGGESMARRILDAIRHQDDSIPLRAGVYSVRGAHGEPVSSLDLLSHATAALRRAQERGEDESNGVTPSVQLN